MTYALLIVFGILLGAFSMFAITTTVRALQKETRRELAAERSELVSVRLGLDKWQEEIDRFRSQAVAYEEMVEENKILKLDLQNIDVSLRKLQLDTELQDERQCGIDRRVGELGLTHLKENVKWIGRSLTPNNYIKSKERLLAVIARCRDVGHAVSPDEEEKLVAALKTEFEKAVKAAFEKEEQSRIKSQIREQQQLEHEIDREIKKLEREREAIRLALEKSLADAEGVENEEIQRLRARLADAEARSQRAISRAQMTKAGFVYVISNIGSFGEGVYKIGMSRRLNPLDRVRELSSASVPFPFDVHMMVSSEDAPKLENALHRAFRKQRVNKIKPRKEFFRTEIETIRQFVEEHHGEVEYQADPEALEYTQSLSMTEEDSEYVESVYDQIADGDEGTAAYDE